MNGMKSFIAFIAGATLGGGLTYAYMKEKCYKKIENDLNAMHEHYKYQNNVKMEENQELSEKKEESMEDVNTFKPDVESDDYTQYSATVHNNDDDFEPYVINPNKFGEIEDYARVTLYYYADKYLADTEYQTVDIDETVGYDALNHFGEYEEDSVYVRNDKLQTDFEILLDARKFANVYSGY